MAFRADILAGKAVIVVQIQDQIDAQLRTIRTKLRRFSNSLSDIGGTLFRFGTVGSFASILPVKEFTQFQDSLLFLQSKLRDTNVDIVQLEKFIRDLGKTTSYTSLQVAEAAAVLAQAGLGEAIPQMLQPVLDLARGARIELDTAGRILSNILSAYEFEFDRAGEVASKLITAARLGTLDVVDIGESLKESLTTFRQLGVPLDDALGMFAQLSNVILRATKAGTSLNTAFANLAGKSKQLEKLGIVISDWDMKNPTEIFRMLSESLSKLTKQEQVTALQSLFNIRGGRAFGGILVQDLSELSTIIDKIKNSSDEARESAVLMDSKLGGAFRRAHSALQELSLAIGSTTEGPLTKILESLTALANNLSLLTQKNPQLVQTLLIIPPAALAVSAGILAAAFSLNVLASAMTPLISLNGMLFSTLAKIAGTPIDFGRRIKKELPSISKLGAAFRTEIKALAAFDAALKHTDSLIARLTRRGLVSSKAFQEVSGASQLPLNLATAITRAAKAPVKLPTQLDLPLSTEIPKVQAAITKVAKARQLKLPLQLELDFGAKSPQEKAIEQILAGFSPDAPGPKNMLGDLVRASVATINDPGQIKMNPIVGVRINQAIADVVEANRVPKELVPTLTRKVNEALEQASKNTGKLNQPTFDFTTALTGPLKQKGFDFKDADIPKIKLPIVPLPPGKAVQQDLLKNVDASGKTLGKAFQTSFLDTVGSTGKVLPREAGAIEQIGVAFRFIGRVIKSATPSIVNFSRSTDFVKKLYDGIRNIGKGLRFVFRILNGIRRVVFSFSGILTILEAIILIGPSIPPIAKALDAIAAAFGTLFSNLGQLVKNVAPAFTTLYFALKQIFTGDIEGGIERVKVALSDMGNVIRTQLVVTWRSFVTQLEPAITTIHTAFLGLTAFLKAALTSIGAIFGAVFKTGTIVIKGDGSFLNALKDIFSTENMKGIFEVILGFMKEVITRIVQAIGSIAGVLSAFRSKLAELVGAIKVAAGSLLEALGAIGVDDPEMIGRGTDLAIEGSMDMLNAVSDAAGRQQDITEAINGSLSNLNSGFQEAFETLQGIVNPPKGVSAQQQAAADAAANQTQANAGASILGDSAKGWSVFGKTFAFNLSDSFRSIIANASFNPEAREGLMRDWMRPFLADPRSPFQVQSFGRIQQQLYSMAEGMQGSLTIPTLPEMFDSATKTLKDGINYMFGSVPTLEMPQQQREVENLQVSAVRALVDSFTNTRNNKLQSVTNKEAEQTTALKSIAANTDIMANQIQPFVFGP